MKVFLNEKMHRDGADWVPDTSDDFIFNINSLLEVIHSFLFLPDVDFFYSSSELARLCDNISQIIEITEYSLTNPIQRLRQLLVEVESKDWSVAKVHRDDHEYYHIYGLGAQNIRVNNTTLAEACEYKQNNHGVSLVNFPNSEFNTYANISVSRADVNPPNELTTYNLDYVIDQRQFIEWFHNNRRERTYTWNKKHGQNGRGMIPNKNEVVSPLECSQEEAAIFLNIAVGSRKSNELYNFDPINNKFMVWKSDGPETQGFHAYHPVNQGEVDDEIKEFIKNISN